jgi:hypothetical protein
MIQTILLDPATGSFIRRECPVAEPGSADTA